MSPRQGGEGSWAKEHGTPCTILATSCAFIVIYFKKLKKKEKCVNICKALGQGLMHGMNLMRMSCDEEEENSRVFCSILHGAVPRGILQVKGASGLQAPSP